MKKGRWAWAGAFARGRRLRPALPGRLRGGGHVAAGLSRGSPRRRSAADHPLLRGASRGVALGLFVASTAGVRLRLVARVLRPHPPSQGRVLRDARGPEEDRHLSRLGCVAGLPRPRRARALPSLEPEAPRHLGGHAPRRRADPAPGRNRRGPGVDPRPALRGRGPLRRGRHVLLRSCRRTTTTRSSWSSRRCSCGARRRARDRSACATTRRSPRSTRSGSGRSSSLTSGATTSSTTSSSA